MSSLSPVPSPISRITFFGLSESSARSISFVLSDGPVPPAITTPVEQAAANAAAPRATIVFLVRKWLLP